MHLKKFISLIIISSLTACNSYASSDNKVCTEHSDKLYCGVGNIDHLNYLGDAVLNGTVISGSTRIIGDLESHHSQINTIRLIGDLQASDSEIFGTASITGNATISNVKFKANTKIVGDTKLVNTDFANPIHIIGDVIAYDTNFKDSLTLAADKVYFVRSTSTTIHFDPTDKPQNLYLNHKSFIYGDIDFPSGRGTVYVSSDSRLNGKVIGGKIVNN